MVLTALRTGMRIGELCGLDWGDVDLHKRVITVRRSLVEGVLGSPKNNRIRYIPISEDLLVALREQGGTKGFIFKRSNGIPLQIMFAWRGLQTLCLKANLRKIGWHALRHTFASHLVMRGVPMRTVQSLMGHSTMQMTERYSHLAPSPLFDAIAMLETQKIVEVENLGQQVGNTRKNSVAWAV